MSWFRRRMTMIIVNHKADGTEKREAPVWLEPGDSLALSDESGERFLLLSWESKGVMRVTAYTKPSRLVPDPQIQRMFS